MTDVIRREGDLAWCEDVPLGRLAAVVGTPTYVYSTAGVRDQYRALDAALRVGSAPDPTIASRPMATWRVLQVLRELGAGVDIVSGGELYRVPFSARLCR